MALVYYESAWHYCILESAWHYCILESAWHCCIWKVHGTCVFWKCMALVYGGKVHGTTIFLYCAWHKLFLCMAQRYLWTDHPFIATWNKQLASCKLERKATGELHIQIGEGGMELAKCAGCNMGICTCNTRS